MALTGIEILKLLPRIDCQQCGSPTCLAFAMRLLEKEALLDECQRLSDAAKKLLQGKGVR